MTSQPNNTDQCVDSIKGEWLISVSDGTAPQRVMQLPDTGELRVGNDLSNDIVLQSTHSTPVRLALSVNRPAIRCRVVEGELASGDTRFNEGQELDVTDQALRVGSLQISFSGVERPALNAAPILTPENNQPLPSTLTGNTPKRSISMPIALLAGTCMLVIAGFLGKQFFMDQQAVPIEPVQLVQNYLIERGYDGIAVVETDGELFLQGAVKTQEEAIALAEFQRSVPFTLNNDFVVTDTVLAAVEDIFRVNGIIASASMDDTGQLHVATTLADAAEVDRIKQIVENDMPDLSNWVIDNEAPVVPVAEDPGKRVAMIVSDDPAFVLTVDQTRYFVGAVLPTGHRISSISDGKVSLVKQGVVSELDF